MQFPAASSSLGRSWCPWIPLRIISDGSSCTGWFFTPASPGAQLSRLKSMPRQRAPDLEVGIRSTSRCLDGRGRQASGTRYAISSFAGVVVHILLFAGNSGRRRRKGRQIEEFALCAAAEGAEETRKGQLIYVQSR